MNFIADDEDNNLHLQDAETITTTVSATAPVFNIQKIYLDAFQQESGSGGGSYPQANAAINNNIYNGTLIWNYNGHGGPNDWRKKLFLISKSLITGIINTDFLYLLQPPAILRLMIIH